MAKHEITKGIPVPPLQDTYRNAGSISDRMVVGDCILGLTQSQAHARATGWRKRTPGLDFRGRKLPDDVRPDLVNRYGIWRVA